MPKCMRNDFSRMIESVGYDKVTVRQHHLVELYLFFFLIINSMSFYKASQSLIHVYFSFYWYTKLKSYELIA